MGPTLGHVDDDDDMMITVLAKALGLREPN